MSVYSKILVGLVLLLAIAQVRALESAWFYMALDAEGQVTDLVVVDELAPEVASQLDAWVRSTTFPPAEIDGQAVRSTTPIWIQYEIDEVDGQRSLRVQNHQRMPRPTLLVEPRYPRGAALSGEHGSVTVEFTIRPSGSVTKVEVLDSSDRSFNRHVVRAVRQWEFQTPTVNGKPVGQKARKTILFALTD